MCVLARKGRELDVGLAPPQGDLAAPGDASRVLRGPVQGARVSDADNKKKHAVDLGGGREDSRRARKRATRAWGG